ncbi:MAG: HlyC/CorC family transporter [Trueperaceae bacterium]|nr:HlyC/CorC family transporter [Trueperaceae bacterium]
MNDWWGIFWLFALLAANAFFVGAEFAVLAARRAQVEPLAARGNLAAKTALWAMEHATLMLACCQFGITVCSLLILNVSEPAIHHLLIVPLSALGLADGLINVVSFAIALALVTFLHVTFGEMIPKNIAFSRPDSSVLLLAPPLAFVSRIVRPLIVVLNGVANGALRLFGIEPKDEVASTFTLEEVATIVETSKREGKLSDESGTLANAFEFTRKRAADLALPLDRVITLPLTVTPRQLEAAVAERGHSRYPLVDATGALAGYLHFKDVIAAEGAALDRPVPQRSVRRLIEIDADTEAEDALAAMRRQGSHLATAVAVGGGVVGVLFLEDIVEELIGEVQDATSGA